jgi:hypothetical protein
MTEEINNDIHKYFETIGIKGRENWCSDTFDYDIGVNILVVGCDFALDDLTNTKFNTLGDIVEFYKLPMIPDNVRTIEDYEEFKIIVGIEPKN